MSQCAAAAAVAGVARWGIDCWAARQPARQPAGRPAGQPKPRKISCLLWFACPPLASTNPPPHRPPARPACLPTCSLDDVVMGGISESGFVVRQGAGEDGGPAGVFAGRVTTQNNGGFASVRTRNLEPALDLDAFEGLQLRVRGDGMRYKLIIRCDPGWDSVGYTQGFDTQPGEQIR